MRAVFCELENSAATSTEIIITGDRAHHLQVVRVKTNEEILVLNGKGARFFATITSITKKEIALIINKIEKCSIKHELCLAIATPKKDAFEDALRIAVELGINEIHPLSSEFSQFEYVKSERIEKLLESALVQSNNAFLPTIYPQVKLSEFLNQNKNPLVYFSSIPKAPIKLDGQKLTKTIIIVGPEAGFSSSEEGEIAESKQVKIIHLPTPIMRAPTAVATSVGYLLGLNF
jgi:16S rRNA (uracil1498-N3)-methyltransferase